jgi:redox-sensitive bicupin YhaK (pirin superfamily)
MTAVDFLLAPRTHDVGGVPVRRLLPSSRRRSVGPFVFFDHIGPAALPVGQGIDVRAHPHIGLATITWLFEGELVHRDSLGFVQPIVPGEVNWMTAGRGIAHSERSPTDERARGVRLHGVQTWIALPHEHEESAPAFHHLPASALPVLTPEGARITVIAGDFVGVTAPTPTFSRMLHVALELTAGATFAIPAGHSERAVHTCDGDIAIDGEPLPVGHMAVLAPGAGATLTARTDARAMLIGGEPVGERFIWWNFVSSSRERIERAKDDWRNQRFARVTGETEFIPLPER